MGNAPGGVPPKQRTMGDLVDSVSRLIMSGGDRTYISDPLPIGQGERKSMKTAQVELEGKLRTTVKKEDRELLETAKGGIPVATNVCLHKTYTVRDSDVRAVSVYEVVCTDLCGQVLGVVPGLIKIAGPAGRFEDEIVRIVEGARRAARAELDLDKELQVQNSLLEGVESAPVSDDPVYSWVDGDDAPLSDPVDDSGIDPASVASAVMPMSFATAAYGIGIYGDSLSSGSSVSRADLKGEIDRLKAEKEKLERKLKTRVVSKISADKGERAIDF